MAQPTTFTPQGDPEDIAAARQERRSNDIGFLPGGAEMKMRHFQNAVEHHHGLRIQRDNAAGVTSDKLTAMRRLKLKRDA